MGGVFKALFDEVHRSNMSKLCKDEEEAKATVAHYKENKATDASYRLAAGGGGYQVFRLVRSATPQRLAPIVTSTTTTSAATTTTATATNATANANATATANAQSDNKTLKSVKYSEASLEPILKEGQADAKTKADAAQAEVEAEAAGAGAGAAAGAGETESEVKEAVSTMRALLAEVERGEVGEEMSAKLDASNTKLQSLLAKRKAADAGQ